MGDDWPDLGLSCAAPAVVCAPANAHIESAPCPVRHPACGGQGAVRELLRPAAGGHAAATSTCWIARPCNDRSVAPSREAWGRFWLFPLVFMVLWRWAPTGWCAAPCRCRQRGPDAAPPSRITSCATLAARSFDEAACAPRSWAVKAATTRHDSWKSTRFASAPMIPRGRPDHCVRRRALTRMDATGPGTQGNPLVRVVPTPFGAPSPANAGVPGEFLRLPKYRTDRPTSPWRDPGRTSSLPTAWTSTM